MTTKTNDSGAEETYRITPRGYLVAIYGLDDGTEIWEALRSFCVQRLMLDGRGNGIPVLIMDEGGTVEAVEKIEQPE